MSGKAALPGLAAGGLGLIAGLLAVVLDNPWFGLVTGVLAATAGLTAYRVAARLEEQGAVQRLVEDELRSVRAEARATEAELRAEVEALSTAVDPIDEHADYDEFGEEGHDPLTDPVTGLFSESFFTVALESRVAAARRHLRPVAVVVLEVVEGLPTDEPRLADADTVTEAITSTLREADTPCRLRNGDFALLLEDTPENGAIWTVERIRRHLAEKRADLTMWAGVACYPAHAFGPAELMGAADRALVAAREWRQDRIEVAVAIAD
jgi:two-component system cell cycle response regulator